MIFPHAVLVYEEVVWCLAYQVYPCSLLTLARIAQGRDTQSLLFGEVVVLRWFLHATHDIAWPDEVLADFMLGNHHFPVSRVTEIVPAIPLERIECFIGTEGLFEADPQKRDHENIPLIA